jgi:6-phosphogluconolactonase (cycloisomerase 2 family)
MKVQTMRLSTSIVAAALTAIVSMPAALAQTESTTGAAFALTNRAADNEVIAFDRAADGSLTQTGKYSTQGNGIGVDFDTQGGLRLSNNHRFLYAVNPGSDTLSVFAVEGSHLTFLQQIDAGDEPLSITMHGNLLYVLDGSVAGNGITGFVVASNGTLTPIPDSFRALSSPIAVPGQVLFSPDGLQLIVTGKVSQVFDVFAIGSDGRPSAEPVADPSAGLRPFAAAFKNDGTLLVVASGLPLMKNSNVSSYHIDTAGAATVLSGDVKDQQTDGCWIVITGNQRYAYTANFASNTISSFRIGRDDTVTLKQAVAGMTGKDSEPVDLGLSNDSHYLYSLLRGTGGIAAFAIDREGELEQLGIFGVGGGLPVNNGASGLAAY